jgi:hypothetical protein
VSNMSALLPNATREISSPALLPNESASIGAMISRASKGFQQLGQTAREREVGPMRLVPWIRPGTLNGLTNVNGRSSSPEITAARRQNKTAPASPDRELLPGVTVHGRTVRIRSARKRYHRPQVSQAALIGSSRRTRMPRQL